MRKECSIVRDLLPLYAEDMVSADTGEFVKEHLEGCGECRAEYEGMKPSNASEKRESVEENKEGTAPLVTLKRKLRKQKIQTMLCTGLFVAALLLAAFAVLSAPVYFPYEKDLFTITENGDESITITFDERVTEYRCEADAYNVSEEGMVREDLQCYQIEAGTSLWSEWFSKNGVKSVTLRKAATKEISVYYVSNNGTEDICVYGEPMTSGGVVTLPRHVLSYYFMLAVVLVGVLLVAWLLVKHKAKWKVVIEKIMYYPISYCVAHMIVAGSCTSTYSAQRDFMLILFLSILIYGGVLLVRSIYRERKEIKALTERN